MKLHAFRYLLLDKQFQLAHMAFEMSSVTLLIDKFQHFEMIMWPMFVGNILKVIS